MNRSVIDRALSLPDHGYGSANLLGLGSARLKSSQPIALDRDFARVSPQVRSQLKLALHPLIIRHSEGATLEIIIRGNPGNQFLLEQSSDLKGWSPWKVIRLETVEQRYSNMPPPTEIPIFFRLRQVDASAEGLDHQDK